MNWKDYFQTASIRQYAMIGGSMIATAVYIWVIYLIEHFIDGKKLDLEQYFQMTKFQLQILAFFGYIAGFGMILFVVALTLTKFSAVTKVGSVSVGQDDPGVAVAKVTTTTTVEKKDGNAT